ncbi:MAG: tRNA pseudouridine(13) synthase TruD [Desulfuromonadales bacterium GWD2_61_12]|nr:MAG: tRNA pseudouridine(13) synthase TruD [Desulfuromonadales bacterium GWD2_61_12]
MTRYLTDLLPGVGGTIRGEIEDFRVEELPLYPTCGSGEHLYVTVEKRGLTTFDLLRHLASALGVRERDIGYAGLKDARALTRQTVSLTGVSAEQVEALAIPGVQILAANRHRNKLRLGHLAGNRFVIRIRGVDVNAGERALDILHVLADLGVPNRFGAQRYGVFGTSHRIGRAILRQDFSQAAQLIVGDPATIDHPGWRQAATAFAAGDLQGTLAPLPPRCRDERTLVHALIAGKSPRDAVLRLPRKLLRLYLSAYQSSLFDRLLEMRLASMNLLWPGDLAYKHVNGACFTVVDATAEQPRADNFEISPTAPLFGHKVTLATGHAGLLESALLEKEGITLRDFRLDPPLDMAGERRPLRVPLAAATAEQQGDTLLLAFELPSGSYATTVLDEVMKVATSTLPTGSEDEDP